MNPSLDPTRLTPWNPGRVVIDFREEIVEFPYKLVDNPHKSIGKLTINSMQQVELFIKRCMINQ